MSPRAAIVMVRRVLLLLLYPSKGHELPTAHTTQVQLTLRPTSTPLLPRLSRSPPRARLSVCPTLTMAPRQLRVIDSKQAETNTPTPTMTTSNSASRTHQSLIWNFPYWLQACTMALRLVLIVSWLGALHLIIRVLSTAPSSHTMGSAKMDSLSAPMIPWTREVRVITRAWSRRDIIIASCWTRLSYRTRDALDTIMLSARVFDWWC